MARLVRKDIVKMKVCFVTNLPNLVGANQSMLDILSKCDKRDLTPVVLIGRHGPLEDELKKLGIRYKIIRYSTEVKKRNFVKNFLKVIMNYMAVFKIRKFFREEKFDLIHNNTVFVRVGIEAAYREKIPYVCHIREFVWEDSRVRLLREKRQYFLMDHAERVIAISNAIKDKFCKILKNAQFEIVYDGIDAERYYQQNHELFKKENTIVMLVGRIVPYKGQLEAVKAVGELEKRGIKNVRLQIVGNVGHKQYYSEIKNYIEENNLSQIEVIEFTSDLRELRRQSDINLVCSYVEGLGRVTVESMLAGCVTIGADTGATNELIKDKENGFLYERGNYNDLAEKILYVIGHKEDMKNITQAAQNFALEKFDADIYYEKIYNIYKSII